jgi:hypothetical protein
VNAHVKKMFRRRKKTSPLYEPLLSPSPSPPKRMSAPIRIDVSTFLRNAVPVTYSYVDSPHNRRRRRVFGIEKTEGAHVGIPAVLQHSAGDVRMIKDECLSALLLVCLRDLNHRVASLEMTISRLRNGKK